VLTQASQSSLSLNEPVDVEGDSELGDLLEQTVLPDTDERILRESFLVALDDALSELPKREQRVLRLRYGLDDDQPKTLREIGEILGLAKNYGAELRLARVKPTVLEILDADGVVERIGRARIYDTTYEAIEDRIPGEGVPGSRPQ